MTKSNSAKNPLFTITKRTDIHGIKAVLIRVIAGVLALLACGIVTVLISNVSFGKFFAELFNGVFGTSRRILNLLQNMAIMLIIALALAPAFKMKFWNIGAEGQVLVGGLMCTICMFYGSNISSPLLILIMFIASALGGAIWALIPAIFKAQWNTNETLFTLMMNYIAMRFVSFFISLWVKSGSGVLAPIAAGNLPNIGGQPYIINIIIVLVATVLLGIYLKYSKHGYEISVVGESMNTARYIGINVKKVIVRTMFLSGLICGIAGFLLVAGTSHTISETTVAGRGFTAILVCWLAKFNPIYMALTSFLVVFLNQGAAQVATIGRLGNAFQNIMTGIFFLFIIASEFFLNYKINFHKRVKSVNSLSKNNTEVEQSTSELDSTLVADADSQVKEDK